jgi:hypothetical protein
VLAFHPASLKIHCKRILDQCVKDSNIKQGTMGEYIRISYTPGSSYFAPGAPSKEHPDQIIRYACEAAGALEKALSALTQNERVFQVNPLFDWSGRVSPCRFEIRINPLFFDNTSSKYDSYKNEGAYHFIHKNKRQIESEVDVYIKRTFKTESLKQ